MLLLFNWGIFVGFMLVSGGVDRCPHVTVISLLLKSNNRACVCTSIDALPSLQHVTAHLQLDSSADFPLQISDSCQFSNIPVSIPNANLGCYEYFFCWGGQGLFFLSNVLM